MVAALILPFLLSPHLASAGEAVEIRIVASDDWGGSPTQDIHAVLASTAKDILKFFPDRKLKPIIVEHGNGMPVTLYERGPNDETKIHINSAGLHWAQFSYQFSHELTHVLAGYERVEPNSPPNMWFEESLCMMGSLFAMRQMSETWKTSPPYPNWKDYAPHLRSYVDDVMNDPKHQLAADTTLAQWYQANKEKLKSTSTSGGEGRDMQLVIASVLLPIFEKTPENWPAIGYLNMKKTGNSSFKEYLDAWQESAPQKYKPFVGLIRAKFGNLETTK
jgi:hypothetical protein